MRTTARVIAGIMSSLLLCGATSFSAAHAAAAASAKKPRLLAPDDAFAIGDVAEPQISPDGRWIAYTVTTLDLEEDESRTRIWMVPAAGGDAVPLTAEDRDSSSPRWSPDGQYLGFLSARGEDASQEDQAQVFTLFREGGEAVQRTDTAQGVESFAWSPDGKRMLLVLQDPKPEDLEAKQARDRGEPFEEKTPAPWVVTRRQFKRDYVGYLDSRRTHLYVLDLATQTLTQVTSGDFDDAEPAWSPDGTRIAFVSNRTQDPDANYNTDIWVVKADNRDRGARPLQITTNPGPDATPSWSPDGTRIAHNANTETDAALYGTNHLAVSSAAGGDSTLLTAALDRMIFAPRFSKRDDAIYFLLEDSGEQNLARISASGGAIERLVRGPRVVTAFDEASSGEIAIALSEPHLPAEVFRVAHGAIEQRSHVNDALLAGLRLGAVEEIRFASADGTEIEAFVIKPPDFKPRRRYPGILLIHGGPQAQFDHRFDFDGQLYAANGYVVVMPNPRGSTGYGQDFCMAIWQAWGERDYEDVMAAVDTIVAKGWADPKRLAVTGWSYGGMLTNHVITKTNRFKAAATGASAALYVVNFGHDHYQRWWTYEVGLPWKPESRQLYERMSPFNKIENVVTPTLILGGEEDWNVPIINSEQLFLALKIRGVPTELVVYPGEFHGIDTPTHIQDLRGRYLAWFARYLR
ncbi:MAG: S9 family peptidase [Myxococcales bacterium]|nr:S9 family peptidase [Myxococcales bacterium]